MFFECSCTKLFVTINMFQQPLQLTSSIHIEQQHSERFALNECHLIEVNLIYLYKTYKVNMSNNYTDLQVHVWERDIPLLDDSAIFIKIVGKEKVMKNKWVQQFRYFLTFLDKL